MRRSHKLLEVVNVGQGDCMLLRLRNTCCLQGRTYFIDTGDGKTDISSYLDDADRSVSVILTHSHMDHIGGLIRLFPKADRIKEMILPFYHNEILLLASALENLLGMEKVSAHSWPVQCIEDYQKGNAMINALLASAADAPRVVFGYEGLSLCDHFVFLNPPVDAEEDNASHRAQIQKYVELFAEPFASRLDYWLTARLEHGQASDTPMLDRDAVYASEEDSTPSTYQAKALFVLSFLEKNYQKMLAFTKSPTAVKLSPIVKSLNLTANQASLVFKFTDGEGAYFQESVLFTGDIDTSTFDRMIARRHDIQADILKVPHHGSKTGLNQRIIKEISPKCGIISHNNRRFGTSKDPHPNSETIKLLQANGVRIFVTNEVVKNGMTVLPKGNPYHRIFDIV